MNAPRYILANISIPVYIDKNNKTQYFSNLAKVNFNDIDETEFFTILNKNGDDGDANGSVLEADLSRDVNRQFVLGTPWGTDTDGRQCVQSCCPEGTYRLDVNDVGMYENAY